MRIQIRNSEHNINLLLPTWLVFGRLTAKVTVFALRYYTTDELSGLSPEKLTALFAELRRIKAIHGRWELVDVRSADGGIVKVIL